MKIKSRLKILKRSAKKRGLKVNLNVKHYQDMLDMGCSYCGDSLHDKGGYGLDRIDSSKGYLNDNVTPCCGKCNMAKSTMSNLDFFNWVEKAYLHQQQVIRLLQDFENHTELSYKKESNKYFNSRRLRNSEDIAIS